MWLLLQLADSAFPAGGFAHSGGLEASLSLGLCADVPGFIEGQIVQAAHMSLPLARAAHSGQVAQADALAEAWLLSHVARRASHAQGRAFFAACSRAFPEVASLSKVRHLAPLQGAICAALGLSLNDAETLVLHVTMRGLLSAAIRLGALGPLEAQALQRRLAPTLDEARRVSRTVALDDVAQTQPIPDLAGALHDELYTRLFQS